MSKRRKTGRADSPHASVGKINKLSPEFALTIFEDKAVRRVLCDGEWYFAVVDVVAALTGSRNPGGSWPCLKAQELATCGVDLSELCRWLEMDSMTSGHRYKVEAATLEGIFRIVQSIASPRAEVFKRWLAMAARQGKKPQGRHTDLDSIFTMLEDGATAAIAGKQEDRRDDGIAEFIGRRIAEEARQKLTAAAGVKAVDTMFDQVKALALNAREEVKR